MRNICIFAAALLAAASGHATSSAPSASGNVLVPVQASESELKPSGPRATPEERAKGREQRRAEGRTANKQRAPYMGETSGAQAKQEAVKRRTAKERAQARAQRREQGTQANKEQAPYSGESSASNVKP